MNYWLVKSDPDTYGWKELVAEKNTAWTGIRNYAARLHLRGMKKGDLVLFYHSQKSQAIVGIAKVTREAYQDPTTKDEAWVAVDLQVVKPLRQEVTLAQIKNSGDLKEFPLVRISRLSVMPVNKDEFALLLKMSDTKL